MIKKNFFFQIIIMSIANIELPTIPNLFKEFFISASSSSSSTSTYLSRN